MVITVDRLYLKVGWFDEEFAQNDHCNDHAKHPQRIGNGSGKGHTSAAHSQVAQCLSGCTEGRCIGSCTAKQTYHVGQVDACERYQQQSKECSYNDNNKTPYVECHAFMTQRTEEIGPYMQTETIDKHGQTEGFSIVKYRGINAETKVPGKDTHKENECNAKGNAHHLELTDA